MPTTAINPSSAIPGTPASSEQNQPSSSPAMTQGANLNPSEDPNRYVPMSRQPRVVIKSADMPDDMQRKAVELALTALDRFELERDMAKYLKKEFDIRFQPSWHCIVGRHFGSYVTHEGAGFLYFYIDKTAVLLFRSG